ncbi:MAG: hypothetical protein SGI92_27555, partial [Bryobacteraceae bacterium]|nr:hypothetical protein [Bryobacteraceae bacterium]
HENPVMVTRQDWRGPGAGWDAKSVGYWQVNVTAAAEYEFTVRFPAAASAGTASIRLNGASLSKPFAAGVEELVVGRTRVAAGIGKLEAEIEMDASKKIGAHYVTIRRL